jgi:hypothetical protein
MAERKPKTTAEDASQSERFIKAAREFGCDESEERFDETLKKVALAGPRKPSVSKPRASKKR